MGIESESVAPWGESEGGLDFNNYTLERDMRRADEVILEAEGAITATILSMAALRRSRQKRQRPNLEDLPKAA